MVQMVQMVQMKKVESGLTLVEVIVTLCIAAIVLASGVPTLNRMIERNRATTSVNWIIGAVNFARHTAVMRGTTVTLCALGDKKCSRDWAAGILMFTDLNQDGKMSGDDALIARLAPPDNTGGIYWRAFRNRPYLQMTQMGYTNFQNGNFVYCPASKDLRFARQVVVNMQGRARVVHVTDADDYPLDRYGERLRC